MGAPVEHKAAIEHETGRPGGEVRVTVHADYMLTLRLAHEQLAERTWTVLCQTEMVRAALAVADERTLRLVQLELLAIRAAPQDTNGRARMPTPGSQCACAAHSEQRPPAAGFRSN